jgi:hypothetical protein
MIHLLSCKLTRPTTENSNRIIHELNVSIHFLTYPTYCTYVSYLDSYKQTEKSLKNTTDVTACLKDCRPRYNTALWIELHKLERKCLEPLFIIRSLLLYIQSSTLYTVNSWPSPKYRMYLYRVNSRVTLQRVFTRVPLFLLFAVHMPI